MYVYEGMFILDSSRYARDPDGVSGQIPKVIQEAGGQMLVSRLWEERRLAYPIKGHRKGTYWLTYFQLPGERLAEIRQKLRLSETILRMLFLRVDPKIVDTLVAHALAGPGAIGAQRAAEGPAGGPEAVEQQQAPADKEIAAKQEPGRPRVADA
ncbi:MAG: 30S ribosomal protein S6 [Thermoguttaceae bacterium]